MPPSVTDELSALYTSTLRKWKDRPELYNQIFEVTPAIDLMRANGRVVMQTGGRKIVENLEYEENPSVQWVDPQAGTVDVTKHEAITENQYDWKLLTGTIWTRHYHASQSAGPYRLFSLQKAFLNNVKNTFGQALEAAFCGSAGSNEPYGVQDLMAEAPGTGTVGIVNRLTYSWFRNGYKDCASRPFSTYGQRDMREAYLDVLKFGNMKDLVILTDQATWSLYHEEVGERQRILDKRYADTGFPTLDFMGAPVRWSPEAKAGSMFFWDSSAIKLYINTLVNLELSGWISDQGNIDQAAHLLMECQNTIRMPKKTKVLFNMAE